MLRFLLADDGAASGGSSDPAPAEGLPADDPNGEGTTPEEVGKVLKSSGININDKPEAADDEEGDDPDAPADDDDSQGDPAPTGDEEPEDDALEDEEEQPAKKTPPAPADDAGDKYSFQVEDANGVTFKLSAEASIEDVLAEFEPKNNGQIIAILDQLREIKEQKATDDKATAEENAKAERNERADVLLKGWGEEAKALQGAKRIAEGEEGEKRVNEVYKFMADENTKRMEAGKPTLNSFEDALDKLENKEARDKAVADAKANKDQARKNGGMVGGSSAPASSGAPIYKAGSANNANQALRSMGLIEK